MNTMEKKIQHNTAVSSSVNAGAQQATHQFPREAILGI
jgi:hypothetical protein